MPTPSSAALAAPERRKAAGGPAPYGWRWHRGELLPVPDEQAVTWLVRHLSGRGWSLQRISDALYGLGIAPPRGERWRRDALHRLLPRAPRAAAAQEEQLPDTG